MDPSAQSEVIAFLSDPATYGVDGPVERIDTHISAIFLAGPRAYKLKRAVTFPYLDYSDPEVRHRYCEREVAVNRRTAPDMYEGVTPVVRTPGGALALGGDGAPVDWVVVMRRFDQDALWDAIARHGGLSFAMVNRLADAVAAFHADAEVRRNDGAAAFRRLIDQNEDELLRHAPEAFDPAEVRSLGEASRRALDRVAALLDRRAETGAVRHCHGDLHLRNICQFDGRPTLFDAIEFSDDIAVIDVLYDLAFLLMDMEHRRLEGLANQVMNRYLSRTRDYDGLAAMPLFLSLRAAIRAHVTASAAAESDEARAYLDLARAMLEPAAPCLIAIGGFSGSGKSTLARAVAPGIGAPPGAVHLQSDTIRKRLFGVAPETRLPATAYDDATSAAVYARIREDAGRAIASGYAAVADATYIDPAERTAIEAAATGAAAFAGLWLDAPAAAMEHRLERRRGDTSDAETAVLRRQLEAGPVATDWRRIAAGDDAAAAARSAVEALKSAGIDARPIQTTSDATSEGEQQ